MSDSIKLDLYNAILAKLESLQLDGAPLFRYVGHYNSQETQNANNFSYDTPAAFIQLSQISWIHTKHEAGSVNRSREQDGTARVTIHTFIHDLRNDKTSFPDHLIIINKIYRALIGLRSDNTINGKFSSARRIAESEGPPNNNLRHWTTTYEFRIQEPPIILNKLDSQPVTLKINKIINT